MPAYYDENTKNGIANLTIRYFAYHKILTAGGQ